MEKAIKLYEELKDMDFIDYQDTNEEDIAYLDRLIKKYGIRKAKEMLTE